MVICRKPEDEYHGIRKPCAELGSRGLVNHSQQIADRRTKQEVLLAQFSAERNSAKTN